MDIIKQFTQQDLTKILGQRLSKYEHEELIENGYFDDFDGIAKALFKAMRRKIKNTEQLKAAMEKIKNDKTKNKEKKEAAEKKEEGYPILKMNEEDQIDEIKKYFTKLDEFEKKKFFMRNQIKGSPREPKTPGTI